VLVDVFPGIPSLSPCSARSVIAAKKVPHTLTGPANAAVVSAERNGLLLLADVLEVLDGAGELHAVDGTGSLEGVLERDTTEEFCVSLS